MNSCFNYAHVHILPFILINISQQNLCLAVVIQCQFWDLFFLFLEWYKNLIQHQVNSSIWECFKLLINLSRTQFTWFACMPIKHYNMPIKHSITQQLISMPITIFVILLRCIGTSPCISAIPPKKDNSSHFKFVPLTTKIF